MRRLFAALLLLAIVIVAAAGGGSSNSNSSIPAGASGSYNHMAFLHPYLPHMNAFAQAAQDDDDSTPPLVAISYPSSCSDQALTGSITVEGTASDAGSGIQKVEAFAHPYPSPSDAFPFEMAVPLSPGDWSEWSIQLSISDDRPHRILVRATDGAGNENWDEARVNSEEASEALRATRDSEEVSQKRVAFVKPTFTNAAYNVDSFYFFYYKYKDVPYGVDITDDLNYMTGEIPLESEDDAALVPFIEQVEKSSPGSIVSVLRDENVHEGHIFAKDGRNAYRALFLFHDEYITQEGYDNLRKFARNGGTVVLIDSNVFYGEVTYNKQDCTVTLVKGHNWEFDGKAVRKGVWERYLDENREWMGSNFINRDISNPVTFDNNPFNYTHFEENEVTNPDAEILIDYGAKFLVEKQEDKNNPFLFGGLFRNQSKEFEYRDLGMKVATYELGYGSGKVIALGLYGERLAGNPDFMNFFDSIILPRALGTKHDFAVDGETFELHSKLQNGGRVSAIDLDKEAKSLTFTLEMTARQGGVGGSSGNNNGSSGAAPEGDRLTVTLPKRLIDAAAGGGGGNDDGVGSSNNNDDSALSRQAAAFTVLVDGKEAAYSQSFNDIERGLSIPLPAGATQVKVIGTQVVPEFEHLLLALGIVLVVSLLARLSPSINRGIWHG